MNNTKERIIQEAAVLFAKNGCKSITMDDIASAMGISKRTIYEIFSDKKELLTHCMHYFFQQSEDMIQSVLNKADNVIDAMFQSTQCDSELMRNTKQTLIPEIQKYFPEVHAAIVLAYQEKRLEISRKLLEKGQADGVFREDLNPELVALLIQGLSEQIILHDSFAPHKKELMILLFTFNYARGIATEKGLKILDKYMDLYTENIKKLS